MHLNCMPLPVCEPFESRTPQQQPQNLWQPLIITLRLPAPCILTSDPIHLRISHRNHTENEQQKRPRPLRGRCCCLYRSVNIWPAAGAGRAVYKRTAGDTASHGACACPAGLLSRLCHFAFPADSTTSHWQPASACDWSYNAPCACCTRYVVLRRLPNTRTTSSLIVAMLTGPQGHHHGTPLRSCNE